MKYINFLIKSLFFCVIFQNVAADSFQTHESIVTAIDNVLINELTEEGREITVKVGKLDPRLRLKECTVPLTVTLPSSSSKIGNVVVKVSCKGKPSWSIYVQNQVEQFGSIMVAKRNLPRGEIIAQDDIELQRVSLGSVRGGYITKMENIVDWVVKKNISMGKTVHPNSIRRQLWVKKGDIVVIIAKNESFEVKMSGIAKSSGAKGDTVKIVNQSSKKVVEGVVIGPGVVQVPM